MSIESLSAWFQARGIPPLVAGALLALVLVLGVTLLVRSRGDRDKAMGPLDARTRSPGTTPTHRAPLIGTTPGVPAAIRDEVLSLIRADQKISAIKLVREATGLGLKESKDIVEALESSAR